MQCEFSDDGSRVRLKGHLTFPDHPAFRAMATRLLASAEQPLVIELSELDFVDSAGLGMFLIARDEALSNQRRLVLRAPRGQVQRMFEIAKFATLFAVEP